jgi:hypothetical protein
MGGRVSARSHFFFYMAVLCALTAFLGFAPTYWLPMTRGAYVANVVAIHGICFFSWTLLFVLQTGWSHRVTRQIIVRWASSA